MHFRWALAWVVLLLSWRIVPAPAQDRDWKAAADALGIKRIFVPADTKIADLIETEGTLVELPLAEFATRLERAAHAEKADKLPARLVKATYAAELNGHHLTGGVAQWVLDHAGTSPTLFPIAPFNLAVQQPRIEKQRAILGDLDGANLGLWIEKPGKQSLQFDWSLRGTPGVQGVAFEMRIPSCPLVAIELKLPADQTLSVPKNSVLMTGPFAAEKAGFKLWRLHVAGRTQVDFLVRRGSDAGNAPRIFSASETRVHLSPEHTLYDSETQIDVLHAPVSELTFDIDPALQPFEVSTRLGAVEKWYVAPPANKPGKTSPILHVQFREPVIGTLGGLRIRCTGPRWTNQEAAIPRIELIDAVDRTETLKLFLHPDQHLERWDGGSYKLVQSATEKDGSQTLTLMNAEADGKAVRPRFLVRTAGVDFTVHQDTRWRIDPSGMTLTSDLQYDLSRGQLFALDVRLPKNANWRVGSVELQPKEALQKWDIAGGVLRVELKQGITPRTDMKLSVQLHDTRDKSVVEAKTIDFPDLEPIGAALREGTLAILADAHQRVTLLQSNLPTSRPEPSLARDSRLWFYFVYRQIPPQGKIRLFPQQPVLQSRTHQIVTFTPDMAKIKADVTIEPIVGQPLAINLFLAGAGDEAWRFEAKGAEIAKKERLPLPEIAALGLGLSAPHGPMLAAGRILDPDGQVWRITFREPLAKSVTLTATQELNASKPRTPLLPTLANGERDWRVPVVVPLDSERIDGEILLQPQGTSLASVQSLGLDMTASPGALGGAFARVLRFNHANLLDAPMLRVKVNRTSASDPAQAILESADLATSVDPAGNVSCSLRLHVWNWRARDLRIVLPAGASVVAGRLNAIDLDRVPQNRIPLGINEDGIEVLIPMSQEAGPQTIELIYRVKSARWFGSMGRSIKTPLPLLPLTPLTVHRAVHLAPGWLPLHQDAMSSFDRRAPFRDSLLGFWHVGRGLADEIVPRSVPAWIEPQRLALLGADNALRRAGPREMPLAEAFSKLLSSSKKPVPLVVDRDIFRHLGLTPKSIATLSAEGVQPFWDGLGLVYVPTPGAALLTSKDRGSRWNQNIRAQDIQGILLSDAVSQAFEQGQDSSGRFCAADQWIHTAAHVKTSSASAVLVDSRDEATTTWWPIADSGADDIFVALRQTQVRGLGLLLAFALAAAGLGLRWKASPRFFFGLTWAAMLTCVAALATAPLSLREIVLGPLVVVVVGLIVAYRQILKRENGVPVSTRPSRSTHKVPKASLAAFLFACFGVLGLCHAQAPEARVVFMLGKDDAVNARVLVRPTLLRWLDEQEKPPQTAPGNAVFLEANYRGRWDDNSIVVKAEFDVYAFNDSAPLIVPLTGVDLLEGSSLDDKAILPVVAPAGKAGYQIVLPKRGFHRLKLAFLVRVAASGELKFAGPAVPCAALSLTAPAKIGKLRLARGLGDESVTIDPKSGEQTLVAQLGHESVVQIDGIAPAAGATPGLKVRELYSWDLRLGNRSAQGLLAYETTGEVSQIEIRLPTTLEIRSVDLNEPPTARRAGAIRAWRIVPQGGGRVLQVDFLQPLTGSFQILLGMSPHGPKVAGAVELRLPLPMRATITDGMMGVRVDELDAIEKATFLGVAAVSPDAFVKEWARLSHREIGAPLHAFSFVRSTKNIAAAALDVTPLPSQPRAAIDLTWKAQPQTIDLIAQLHVNAASDLYLLPIKLPENIVLRDIQGSDVHHWSRNGSALQVWLTEPRKKTSITVLGWISHAFPKTKTINLPSIGVVGASIDPGRLTLASSTGIALDPVIVKGLIEEPAENSNRIFRSAGGPLPTEFQLRPQTPTAEFEALTTTEVREGVATVQTHVHGRVDHGDFPEFQIRVANWPTSTPRLVRPFAGAKIKHAVDGKDHVWTISLPPGSPQHISFSIAGQTPLPAGKTLGVPDIRLERGGQLTESLIALAGAQAVGPSVVKMANVRSGTKELMAWPVEHARLRAASAQYGRSPGPGRTINVQAKSAAVASTAQILTARHRMVVGANNHWLHQMTWTIWATAGLDLEITLPPASTLTALLLDDQPTSPRPIGPDAISLPIPPGLKPRTVVAFWKFADDLEPLTNPRLVHASLNGLEPIPIEGEIHLPSGWDVTPHSWLAPTIDILNGQIEAEGRTLQILGDDLASPIKAAQTPLVQSLQTFAALVGQAQYRLQFIDDPNVREAAEKKLKQSIDEEQKRTKAFGLDAARAAADRMPWQASTAFPYPGGARGVPLGWIQPVNAAAPRFVLHRTGGGIPFIVPIVLALVVLVLPLWTSALKAWVQFWPEQLAVVVALGFMLGGFSLVGCGLLLIALGGRYLNLHGRVRRFLRSTSP